MPERAREAIIDTDVHQRIKSPKDFYPYLSRAWRQDIDMFGLRLTTTGSGGHLNGGTGGYREDSYPDDGTMAGSDLRLMQEQLLDFYDIEYAILTGQDQSPISQLPNADYAAAIASAYNDWMTEHWLEKEPRLRGLAAVALHHPAQAAKEVERIKDRPGMVGVGVTNGARYPYGQRIYDPLYEVLNDLEWPLVLHVGGEGAGWNGSPTPVGYPSYYIEARQNRSMGYQAHITSMIFEGTFERFPKLKVVLVEGGYIWLPTFLWRLDADWKSLRDQTPWVSKAPSEYVFEHFRFTTQPMEDGLGDKSLLQVFEWGQAEKVLMFATDYPHWDFDSPEQALPRMPQEMRQRIMSENARELYKLPARVPEAVAAD